MDFRCHSHRFGLELLNQVYPVIEKQIFDVIGSISDEDIIQFHEENSGTGKSINKTLNSLLKAGSNIQDGRQSLRYFRTPNIQTLQRRDGD